MTPEQAAALLGVNVDAGETAVRRAFRSRARAAHPDSGGAAIDLTALTEARDLLLSPPGPPARPEPTTSVDPAASASTRRARTTSAAPPGSPGGSFGRMLFGAISAVIGLVTVGLFVIIVVALAIGSGVDDSGDTPSSPTANECLIVTGQGVAESSCDAPAAQRIVAEYSGARTCPPGSNSLVVASTTWCLEPASP